MKNPRIKQTAGGCVGRSVSEELRSCCASWWVMDSRRDHVHTHTHRCTLLLSARAHTWSFTALSGYFNVVRVEVLLWYRIHVWQEKSAYFSKHLKSQIVTHCLLQTATFDKKNICVDVKILNWTWSDVSWCSDALLLKEGLYVEYVYIRKHHELLYFSCICSVT